MDSLDIIYNTCELNGTYAGQKISFIYKNVLFYGIMISNEYCLTTDGVYDILSILKLSPVYYLLDYSTTDNNDGLVKKINDASNLRKYPAVYFLSDNYVNKEIKYLINKINTHYLLSLYRINKSHRGFIEWINGDYCLNLGKCHIKDYNNKEYDGYVYLVSSEPIFDINKLFNHIVKYSLICLEEEYDSPFIYDYVNLDNNLRDFYSIYRYDGYSQIEDMFQNIVYKYNIIKMIDYYLCKVFYKINLQLERKKYLYITSLE